MPFILKVVLSSLIILAASELGKKHVWAGAILASLPMTSILVLSWLHVETGDASRVAEMSRGIFWGVLPSLLFFIVLPALLKRGVSYWPALAASMIVMSAGYALYVKILHTFRIPL
ncbi:MAG: DUF3147 family protein [Elusimicrobiota bacterium]